MNLKPIYTPSVVDLKNIKNSSPASAPKVAVKKLNPFAKKGTTKPKTVNAPTMNKVYGKK